MDRRARTRLKSDMTLDDLVDESDAVLREVAPRQTRYAVSDRPDARTIRYYTSRGLLPKPLSYEGGRARYGWGHLVRVLAIKKMQSEHMTLEQIARALDGVSLDEIERLAGLREGSPPAALPARSDVVPRPRASGHKDDVTLGRAPRDDAHELELAPGGVVRVPAAVMRDAAARGRLAENLEGLARMLRAMGAHDG